MGEKAFSKIMRGLEEAKAYLEVEREGYRATGDDVTLGDEATKDGVPGLGKGVAQD